MSRMWWSRGEKLEIKLGSQPGELTQVSEDNGEVFSFYFTI